MRAAASAALLAALLGGAPGAFAQEAPAEAPAAAPPPPPAAPLPPTTPAEPRLGFDESDFVRTSAAEGVAGAWAIMVKGVVALAAVLMAIYLVLGKGLAKMANKQSTGHRIHVVDRVGLDAKRTLYLVEVDGVRTLVGVGEGAPTIAVIPDGPRPAFKDVIRNGAAPEPPATEEAALAAVADAVKQRGDA